MQSISRILLVLAVLFTGACGTQKASTGTGAEAPITDTYWRLTELMGKPVSAAVAGKKEVYIRLRSNGNLESFAGCNGVGGRFEVKPGLKISFSNMMGTMMACDELAAENKLLEALRQADNYIHHGKVLLLNKGRKAPLARFEADYSK